MNIKIYLVAAIIIGCVSPTFAEDITRNPFLFDKAPPPTPVIKKADPPAKRLSPKPKEPQFIWKVQGIFLSEKGNYALLNYGFVSVGDVVHGWTVTEIDSESVHLKKGLQKIKVQFE